MRQGRGGSTAAKNKKCATGFNRRSNETPPLNNTPDDPVTTWKREPGVGPSSEPPSCYNNANSNSTFNSNQGPPYVVHSPFPGGPPHNAGSPAGHYPPAGSSTPHYTSSPAPSGSSTPGPTPQPPYPTNANSNTNNCTGFVNGPSPYGSPSSNSGGAGSGGGGPCGSSAPYIGRPNSSGPQFITNPHFSSPSQPQQFGSPLQPQTPHQFALGPPGSPHFAGHGPPMHASMMHGPHSIDRLDHPPGCIPMHRRPMSYMGGPCHSDVRIYELNKRLQDRPEDNDHTYWETLANDFFEDDSQLTLNFALEDGAQRYSIGRTLIPRYFRSIFDGGGVQEVYYVLRHPKESYHQPFITLDCDHCTMVANYAKPTFAQVCTEGRLTVDFTADDLQRIRKMEFTIRSHKEYIHRGMVLPIASDPAMAETFSKNVSRHGIPCATFNYLRLCVILEPMSELMARHKGMPAISPRDCLKTCLYQKWQRMTGPTEASRPASKRRKRKVSTTAAANANAAGPISAATKKRSPATPNFSLASQDVMVVGEPSLMGGDFGDEDERQITRLENTQYDASMASDHPPQATPTSHHPVFGSGGHPDSVVMGGSAGGGPGGGGPPSNRPHSNNSWGPQPVGARGEAECDIKKSPAVSSG